jgi:tetratricopeptide (TPR) repeat protein
MNIFKKLFGRSATKSEGPTPPSSEQKSERGKVVLGVAACLDCNRMIPGGIYDCPHCHSSNLQMAVRKDVLDWMARARAKTDEGARCLVAGDVQTAIKLTRDALAMNPWHATAHGNLGDMLSRCGEFEEAAECLERALYLCHFLEGARERMELVAQKLGKPVSLWRNYTFAANFQFGTEEHALDSVTVLPDALLQRMERPKLTNAPNGSFLHLAGDPLTKAEIWYTVLALDACGFSKMAIGLPNMSREERDRVLKRFLPGRM